MNRLRKKCESLEKKSRLPSLISEQPFLSAIFWRCLWAREGFDGDGARAVRARFRKGRPRGMQLGRSGRVVNL